MPLKLPHPLEYLSKGHKVSEPPELGLSSQPLPGKKRAEFSRRRRRGSGYSLGLLYSWNGIGRRQASRKSHIQGEKKGKRPGRGHWGRLNRIQEVQSLAHWQRCCMEGQTNPWCLGAGAPDVHTRQNFEERRLSRTWRCGLYRRAVVHFCDSYASQERHVHTLTMPIPMVVSLACKLVPAIKTHPLIVSQVYIERREMWTA